MQHFEKLLTGLWIQVAFEDLKKEILVGHQEIAQGKVTSVADVRKEFGLD